MQNFIELLIRQHSFKTLIYLLNFTELLNVNETLYNLKTDTIVKFY